MSGDRARPARADATSGGRTAALAPKPRRAIADARSALPTGGTRPLPLGIATEMGQRFGADFSSVRLHDGIQAQQAADDLHARAYTVGEDIVLGAGAPSAESRDGKRMLAHELAHVVQQRRGGPPPALSPHASHEAAADRAASAVMGGAGAVTVGGATGVGVAREEDEEKKKKKATSKPGWTKGLTDEEIADLERKKAVLETFADRAHDEDAELDEEKTTNRSGGSEKARHRTRSKDVHKHHGFPKFIGGNRIQTYIKLTDELHYLYHEELYLLLEDDLKQRGVLPKDAGRSSRKYYGKMVASLTPEQQKELQAKVIEHAKEFDDRYRATEYPDKRQKLETAVKRGIQEADQERAAKAKAKTATKAKKSGGGTPGGAAGAPGGSASGTGGAAKPAAGSTSTPGGGTQPVKPASTPTAPPPAKAGSKTASPTATPPAKAGGPPPAKTQSAPATTKPTTAAGTASGKASAPAAKPAPAGLPTPSAPSAAPKVEVKPLPKLDRTAFFKAVNQLDSQARASARFTGRIKGYVAVAGGLFQALDVLDTLSDAQKMLSQGTIFGPVQQQAEDVEKRGGIALDEALERFDEIPIISMGEQVRLAEQAEDADALLDIMNTATAFARELDPALAELESTAVDLAGRAEVLGKFASLNEWLASKPQGWQTFSNAQQLAMYQSLERLSGTLRTAASHFAEAAVHARSMRDWGESLNTLAHDAYWRVLRTRAVRKWQADQAARPKEPVPGASRTQPLMHKPATDPMAPPPGMAEQKRGGTSAACAPGHHRSNPPPLREAPRFERKPGEEQPAGLTREEMIEWIRRHP